MALGSIYNAYPGGRPSGLPDDIVDQLVHVKQLQLLTPIQQDIQTTQSRKDNYTSLSSKLVDLYKAADDLDSSSFLSKSATSADDSILTASQVDNPHTGTYSITVTNIAKAHHLIIGVDDSDPATGVTKGISDPNNATLIQDNVTLSFYHKGTLYSYTTDSSTSLNDLANEITNDNNSVYATVTNIGTQDDPQYVLSIYSEVEGSGTNQITTDAAGTTTGVTLSADLFSTGATEQQDAQLGENAQLTVDGVSYSRSSNEIDDIIQGLTLNLTDTGSTTLTVSINTSDIVSKIQTLVDAYNNFEKFMTQNASYDLEDKKAGPLLGDSIARSAQNNIRSILASAVTGTTGNSYQYLSQIGIQFNEQGTLELDQAQLENALNSHPDDVADLFTGENGIASRLKNTLSTYTDSATGIIPKTIKSIEKQLDHLNIEYSNAQEDVKEYEEQTVKKYSHLEEVVLKYKAIQQQLDSYSEQWKKLAKA